MLRTVLALVLLAPLRGCRAALEDRQVIVIGQAEPIVAVLVVPLGDVFGRFVAVAVCRVRVKVAFEPAFLCHSQMLQRFPNGGNR